MAEPDRAASAEAFRFRFFVWDLEGRVVAFRTPDCQLSLLDAASAARAGRGLHDRWVAGLPEAWRDTPTLERSCSPHTCVAGRDFRWNWRQLYVVATGCCNLACVYCAQSRGPEGEMPAETMKHHAAEFLRSSARPETITFYGGEPLLNWPAVRDTIRLVRQQNDALEITVFTNGSLIDEEIATFLADHAVEVIVSLDGDAASHDRARRLRSGAASYQQAEAGWRQCQQAGCAAGISCVVGPHNAGRIAEVTRHLCQLGPANIGMNILHAAGRSGFSYSAREGARAVVAAAQTAAEYGLEIEQFARRLRPLVYEQPRRADCPGCGARLVVTPDGRYGPCEGAYPFRPEWFFPQVEGAWRLAESLADWPCSSAPCRACPAVGLCGGGCALDAYLAAGSLSGRDDRTCELSMAVLDFALGRLVRELDGRTPPGVLLSVQEKAHVFSRYLSTSPRPMRTHSLFGERDGPGGRDLRGWRNARP